MSTLTLREAPPERLDFLSISPLSLKGLSQGEAERLEVGTSRRGVRLGDCFAVSLDGSDTLTIEGGHERLDHVGASLSDGAIRVVGDVGQRCGAGMAAGTVTVTGNAGPYAGSGATGGTITIEGDAGDFAGGAVYAAKAGLDGATLIVHGNAGDHCGDRMRRGLILVGRAGAHAGSRMIAGTIAALEVGDLPGFGMTEVAKDAKFVYSFDNLAAVIDAFTTVKKLDRYAIYVFDYGAPVGWRLAVAHPEKITAIISQNGNAYEAGLSAAWAPIQAYWAEPTP